MISATSFPAHADEPPWVDQFIEHLNKRAEDGGTKSQPESTEAMVKLMVDYCIGSYERPPAKDAPAKDAPPEVVPAEDGPAEVVSAEVVSAEDGPAEVVPAEAVPAEDVPAEDGPAEDGPAEDGPVTDEPGDEVSDTNTEKPHWRYQLSIRQIFSNYINVLVCNP